MANIIKKILKDPLNIISVLEIDELEKAITFCADKYYNTAEPAVDDHIYDIMIDFLRSRNPKSIVLKNVGATVKSKNKVVLDYYLGSMDKIKPDNPSYFENWLKKYKAPYMLSDKLDGVSALLIYDTKNNIKLYTRGTATEGTDITNMIKYLSLPSYEDIKKIVLDKKLKTENPNNIISLRGELIIKSKTFDKSWADKLKNARNSVSGVVNSKKINPDLAKDIDLVLYEIVDPFLKFSEQFKLIETMGFNTVNYIKLNEINFKILSDIYKERREKSIYKVDGIIVTNDIKHERSIDINPDYAFAFKDVLEDQKAITKIIEIEWNVSKNGNIIPTVIIEPVDIGGVTINRITASNARNVMDSMLGKGATIEVIRSGDVIPKIQKVIKGVANSMETDFPKYKWHWNETKVHIVLDNINSDDINIKTISSFFTTVETKGLGEGVVTRLYNAGYKTIEDIICIKKKDLIEIEGFKEKSSDNIIKAINDSLTDLNLATFMTASNLLGDNIGIKRIQQVIDSYPKLLTVYKNWTKNEFIEKIKEVDGWNDNAEIFVSNFNDFMKFYLSLSKYISFKKNKQDNNVNSKLSGLTMVISGFRNAELQEKLEDMGVRFTTSVSKNTDYVIVKDMSIIDEPTGKIKKAIDIGVKVITVDMLNKMM
jgi:DNA ligase (NAD+)